MSTGRHWVSRHHPVTQSVRDDEGDIESYLEEVGGFHFLIFIREIIVPVYQETLDL